MPDLAELFRWQWMWKSRSRLIAIAVGVIVFGVVVIVYGSTRPVFNKGPMMVVIGGVVFVGMGGYQLLQGVLSPAGAFGDHDYDDSREGQRRPWRQRRRKPTDDRPIPLPEDSHEHPPS